MATIMQTAIEADVQPMDFDRPPISTRKWTIWTEDGLLLDACDTRQDALTRIDLRRTEPLFYLLWQGDLTVRESDVIE